MERDSKFQIPKITVLMPVYNCALYVGEAIDSILNQTFTDFEFLIIDDASTDETVSIINTYTDHRINLIEKPKNTGYTNSLNYGLSIARGEYIARMDGDDISLPERFAKQVAFMDLHPKVVVLGTNYSILESKNIKNPPIEHNEIKAKLLYKNCIGHPTVMLRNSILTENSILYDCVLEPAEDYDLWVRLLAYGKLFNLPDVLLKYRQHENQVSLRRHNLKPMLRAKIRLNMLRYVNYSLNIDEENLLMKIFVRNEILNYSEIINYKELKNVLIKTNANQIFSRLDFNDYFERIEETIYKDYFLNRKIFYPILFYQYFELTKGSNFNLNKLDLFKLFVKSTIFFKGSNK